MARHESEREDLMAEAVALSPRIALHLSAEFPEVIAGFRKGGRWSLYFGEDPAYHFEASGALRRAYVQGKLYRAEGETLAELVRVRAETQTQLVRTDLSLTECARFLEQMRAAVQTLWHALETDTCSVLQQLPAEPDCRPELQQALRVILETDCPIAAPLR